MTARRDKRQRRRLNQLLSDPGDGESSVWERASHPRRSVVGPITLGRPAVLTQLVADVLHAAKQWKNLAAGAAVVIPEVAGEALLIANAPVGDQPGEPATIHSPAPGRPDRPRRARVALLGEGFRLRLVVARRQENLMPVGRPHVG